MLRQIPKLQPSVGFVALDDGKIMNSSPKPLYDVNLINHPGTGSRNKSLTLPLPKRVGQVLDLINVTGASGLYPASSFDVGQVWIYPSPYAYTGVDYAIFRDSNVQYPGYPITIRPGEYIRLKAIVLKGKSVEWAVERSVHRQNISATYNCPNSTPQPEGEIESNIVRLQPAAAGAAITLTDRSDTIPVLLLNESTEYPVRIYAQNSLASINNTHGTHSTPVYLAPYGIAVLTPKPIVGADWTDWMGVGLMKSPSLKSVYSFQRISTGGLLSGSWVDLAWSGLSGPPVELVTPAQVIVRLQPGAYKISCWSSAFAVGMHQIRLYNITTASVLYTGSLEDSGTGQNKSAFFDYEFYPQSITEIKIQQRCEVDNAVDGLGKTAPAWSTTPLYAEFNIETL